NPGGLRRDIDERQALMADADIQHRELQPEIDELVLHQEQQVAAIMARLDRGVPAARRGEIERDVREQLKLKLEATRSLATELTAYYDRLQALNVKEQQAADLTEQIAAFIDQHILWIRSAEPISRDDFLVLGDALRWLARGNPAAGAVPSDRWRIVEAVWPESTRG